MGILGSIILYIESTLTLTLSNITHVYHRERENDSDKSYSLFIRVENIQVFIIVYLMPFYRIN